MKRILWIALGVCAFGLVSARPASAVVQPTEPAKQQDEWKFELTPYAWFVGIDADVKVNGQNLTVDQKFKDIIEHVDAGAELMAIAEYNRWMVFGQGDYLQASGDGDVNAPDGSSIHATADVNLFIGTIAGGYTFDGFVKNSTISVLGGLRYANLDTTVDPRGAPSASKTSDITDALVMLRPSFQLSEKWRFNPTLDIGAGDSDLTWELQPQFQYQINQYAAARIGYRRLHYTEKGSNNSEFDGSFSGFILGLGVTL